MLEATNLQQLGEIVRKHNNQPMGNRQSWLDLNPDDQEITVRDTVNYDLNSGRRLLAQIVPEWGSCGIDEMESDGYEWAEDCIARSYYEEKGESVPSDVFKADWQVIFVEQEWKSGEETVSDRLSDFK